jgi:hypothetical protein
MDTAFKRKPPVGPTFGLSEVIFFFFVMRPPLPSAVIVPCDRLLG